MCENWNSGFRAKGEADQSPSSLLADQISVDRRGTCSSHNMSDFSSLPLVLLVTIVVTVVIVLVMDLRIQNPWGAGSAVVALSLVLHLHASFDATQVLPIHLACQPNDLKRTNAHHLKHYHRRPACLRALNWSRSRARVASVGRVREPNSKSGL